VQAQVDDGHLGTVLACQREGRGSVGHAAHVVAARFERADQDVAEPVVVFDDENRRQDLRVAVAHSGSSRVTEVPWPVADCQDSDPPIWSAKARARKSPSPSPAPAGLVVKNGSPALADSSGAIPRPWSVIRARNTGVCS